MTEAKPCDHDGPTVSDSYRELLHEVTYKVPGETRHETARRLIRQAEQRPSNDPNDAEVGHEQ